MYQDEERGLEGVLGLVGIVQKAPAHAQHHRPVPPHQRRERRRVLGNHKALQEVLIGQVAVWRRTSDLAQERDQGARRFTRHQGLPGKPPSYYSWNEAVRFPFFPFWRHLGPFEDEGLGRTWDMLLFWAGQRGLLGPRTKLLGVDHDNPHVTPPDKLRYDAGISTDKPVEPEGEVGVQEIAGGEYAVATHKGPYETLPTPTPVCTGNGCLRVAESRLTRPGFSITALRHGKRPRRI
jgi:hypothetical protein